MPWDLGFNFRSTAGYVTDPAYGVPVLGEAYPHTYMNANGDSTSAGVSAGTVVKNDNLNTNDPRIAGALYAAPSEQLVFTINLAGGNGPGAGTYAIDAAFGDAASSRQVAFTIFDDTTPLITFAKTFVFGGHYIDASLADVVATTTWGGTVVEQTFATTLCKIVLDPGAVSADYYPMAHIRLTWQWGPIGGPLRRLSVRGA